MVPESLLCAAFELSLESRHPIYISIIRAVKKAMMEARKKNTAKSPLATSPSSGCGIRESRKILMLKPRARAAGRNFNTRRQAPRLPNKTERKTAIFIRILAPLKASHRKRIGMEGRTQLFPIARYGSPDTREVRTLPYCARSAGCSEGLVRNFLSAGLMLQSRHPDVCEWVVDYHGAFPE